MVDLPAPESPVNHSTAGFCPAIAARAFLCTSTACQWMFAARRSAKRIRPMPTVLLEKRSMMMKEPRWRFST